LGFTVSERSPKAILLLLRGVVLFAVGGWSTPPSGATEGGVSALSKL